MDSYFDVMSQAQVIAGCFAAGCPCCLAEGGFLSEHTPGGRGSWGG